MQQLLSNQAREHVILSVCALAAKRYNLEGNNSSSAWQYSLANQWATRAGQLVFQEVDDPQEENIVTLVNLTLFWYEEGQWRKSCIYQGNAILIAQVALSPNALEKGLRGPFQDEMQRRRLWACYLMTSYSSETYLQKWTFQLVKNLGLPCREEEFSPDMARTAAPIGIEGQNVGLAGELIRIICLWQVDPKECTCYLANSTFPNCRNKTCELIQNKPRNMQSYLVAVQELDLAVSKWHGGLQASFRGLDQGVLAEPNTSPILYLLHFFYHQCLCSMHASVVPLFCWGGFTTDANPLAQQLSAQAAFEHSRSISGLASSILAGAFPASRGNSFFGYACYCACAVIIPFLRCTNAAVRARAHQDVLANLTLMRQLGTYWKFTKLLGANIQTIYNMHSQFTHCIEDEPKHMSLSSFQTASLDVRRVTSSILGHNKILRAPTGAVALNDAEVTDLGFGEAFGEDTIGTLIQEIKTSLDMDQTPQSFDAGSDDLSFNYSAQTFVSQQQLEFINGCPFVFPGNMDFTAEDNSIFSFEIVDS
ncbi:hypothetical protein NLG97_g5712 [Lecanicillium saksenae]|uniref:Uncharacterized protein n=1 Tax=Lecanicillium saksenae TaxID=468837 RepID=A0ACC1QRV3_9HYPO|nr:hypothetical protein NLG97_g5712 [Lecanicillium saksenae]